MSGRFAYVSCADDRDILVYRMDQRTGALARVATTWIPGLEEASPTSPLAISPNRRFLYAALRLPPFPVASFAIDQAEGTLRRLGGAMLADSMASIATDRTGRWLIGASYGGAIVAVSPIDEGGVAGGPATQVIATPPKAHSVLVDAANRFVYVACLGGDTILCWSFDPALGLSPSDTPRATPVRAGAGPRHLAFGRGETMLYSVNELDGTVDAFARDPGTGVLSLRQTVATMASDADGKAAAADIHVTPDGRFLYASVRSNSTIAAFRIEPSNGTLELIDRFAVERTPRGFAIDPDGRFLICAGRDASTIGVYAIDAGSGRLQRIAQHGTEPNPNWVEIVDLPGPRDATRAGHSPVHGDA